MSLHFFYDFRDDLVKRLNETYSKEIEELNKERAQEHQLTDATMTINNYFGTIHESLKDVIEASDGEILIESEGELITRITIHKNYLQFFRKPKSIEVKMGYYIPEVDLVEDIILSNIVPGEKRCKIKKIGKIHSGGSFDEGSIDYYMREAFSKSVGMGV